MSNLPLQSAVIHNDDNDDQSNSSSTTNKLSTITSRITSPLIIKRQQNIETEIANNQAYDEVHDLQPKHSLTKRTNVDNPYAKNSIQYYQTKLNNSHELMQGNYYDQTRYDMSCSSSSTNHLSEPVLIDINVEDYKKTIAPTSTSKNNSNKARSSSPPFGDTSESIQQGIAQSAGILLEVNKKQQHHHHKTSMKNSSKSHERAVINYFPTDNDDDNNKQRSLSPSSSDYSTSDSSTSNKCQEENNQTNIPYEKLSNDEDDEDEGEEEEEEEDLTEPTKKPLTESTTLLNKNLSQTYGTQTTATNNSYERGKYLPTNGYNSHGSSITTKSSSDNSGSIRTNSGSDNDEESDEEHYNNSTISNHSHSTTSFSRINDHKSLNKSNDIRHFYSNEPNSYQSGRSNTIRSEQIDNNDERHLQVPRFKQPPNDHPNGNTTKLTTGSDHNTLSYTYKRSLQQSSNNLSSSSSHQNRNPQEQANHSNLPRQKPIRTTKKRKQSQQQEIIRTELIPGHRGDRDVDELVMFIDGNSSKQRQNSASLHPTDTNKPKFNSLNDPNSNKTTSRKKTRKSIKILQQSISSIISNENTTPNYLTSTEHDVQSNDFINEDNQTIHSIIDITNQPSEHRNVSTDDGTININSTKTTNGTSSLPNWFEQTRNTSLQNDDVDSHSLLSTITNNSNSEIISEPFVTVTHRRRLVKERRQDNQPLIRSSRLPPSLPSSTNVNDKRRTIQNGIQRPVLRNNLSNNKPIHSPTTKDEEHITNPTTSESVPSQIESLSSSSIVNPINEQSFEKRQSSSPRLSSHSSSSSLSSLIKRQSKPPPVVFLNKSNDIELNDVSFGFGIDSTILNRSSDETNHKPSTNELNLEYINTSIPPSNEPVPFNEFSPESTPEKSTRKYQQRINRGPQFYSGSDIRPQHHHRNYPSQSSYIDPLVLLQYNQRLANYSQQLAYMNLLRAPYISPQSQYVYLPTTFQPPTTAATTNETDVEEETGQPSSEPLLVYATPTGQIYFHPSTTKKSYDDSEVQQPISMPTVYTTTHTVYPPPPPPYYYSSQQPHLIPSHPAFFQPIPSSSSLLIDTKSEQNDVDVVDIDDDYQTSRKSYLPTRQQSSSDIMSNALQLVYSQQRRNAQTDRFNLDDLTAYLAMKWTDTVDHYEQGDNRILLVDEQ